MKTFITTTALVLSFGVAGLALAEGTRIEQNSTIHNKGKNNKTQNYSEGKNSVANTGSIFINQAKISNSTIDNKSENKNTLNSSTGVGSTANTGSIAINKGVEIKGSKVFNDTNNTDTNNISGGENSIANTGSVDIR
ncbi:MAG: hypothetical protein ABL933_05020 [Methyloglobulus sp.]|nr:hypothetical protein [Methyloglobulus sp.]